MHPSNVTPLQVSRFPYTGGMAESPATTDAWWLIRQARQHAGISQRELAARASTSQSAIASYESGKRIPNFATLTRLIDECGLELDSKLTPKDERSFSPDIWMNAPSDKAQLLIVTEWAKKRGYPWTQALAQLQNGESIADPTMRQAVHSERYRRYQLAAQQRPNRTVTVDEWVEMTKDLDPSTDDDQPFTFVKRSKAS